MNEKPTKRQAMTMAEINREATRLADEMMLAKGRIPGGPVNWADWRDRPRVQLCEAIALSLDRDPGTGWRTDADFAGVDGYADRMRVVGSHTEYSLHSGKGGCDWFHDLVAQANSPVDLREFGAWAKGIMGWTLPEQFPGNSEASVSQAPIEAEPVAALQRQAAQNQTILTFLQQNGFALHALPSPPRGRASPAKQAVREGLGYTKGVVDHAWRRLLKDGKLKYAGP